MLTLDVNRISAQPAKPNGTDSPPETENVGKVLAILTPVEDSRENGEEPTKDIECAAKPDSESVEPCAPKIPPEEVRSVAGGPLQGKKGTLFGCSIH